MRRVLGRLSPALIVACVALFAALAGSVYAGKRINGHSIKVKSMPGNRLAPGSVPGNRLRPGAIPGGRIAAGSITGAQIDAGTLGKVPSAAHADRASSAADAGTALHAVSAENARAVNGHVAGCVGATRQFAGECWEVGYGTDAMQAPAAALACAHRGGALPDALALAAFSRQPGIALDANDEWSNELAIYSGKDSYSVATVTLTGEVDAAFAADTKKFRCVFPIVK